MLTNINTDAIIKISEVSLIVIIYSRANVPYRMSTRNVVSIYCTYVDKDGEHKIKVNDSVKKTIIPEISKFRESGIEGSTGTIRYKFTIQLVNGNSFVFCQTSSETVALELKKDKFFRNIEAPKTAKFIERFIADHNLAS